MGLISLSLKAQLSVSVAPGFMNYAGDLQEKSFTTNQAGFAFSAGLMYNITNHVILHGDITTGKVKADDKFRQSTARRNLNFLSNITEAALCLQYDIFDISRYKFTPYIYGGIGFFHFNPYTYTVDNKKVYLQPLGTEGQGLPEYPDRQIYSLTQLNNLLGGGLKYRISDNFAVALEFASRLLYTDYLDDVSTTYPAKAALQKRSDLAVELSFRTDEIDPAAVYKDNGKRGNAAKNDIYYTCLFKFIYSFSPEGFVNSFTSSTSSKKISTNVACPKSL